MNRVTEKPYPGLYVHIPFCKTRCPYCSFYSTTDLAQIDPFLHALSLEAASYRGLFPMFDTLYIGGGTPSVLNENQFETLFHLLRDCFPLTPHAEITVEVNPADLSAPMFSLLRSCGVNRLNIGVQSFHDDTLAFLGRRHRAGEAKEAFSSAYGAGFRDLGLDLLYGVPGQTTAAWMEDLGEATKQPVNHLSCYELTIEGGTPLDGRFRKGGFNLPDEGLQLEFFLDTSQFLAAAGFIHYEVSNFAKGAAALARHNRKYWRHIPYLGLGPAAHSFDGKRRRHNHGSLDAYLADLNDGKKPVAEEERLTREQRRLEVLFLGFRTAEGIDVGAFDKRFETDLLAEKALILAGLKQEGLITIENGFIRPTLRGMAIADQLALI
ncbi:MAG: radical SAM family heme chaperone HemW [Syntrophales bacterium]